jgi:hypothetical protein
MGYSAHNDHIQLLRGARVLCVLQNMGHINYGHGIFDPKGLLGNVTLNSVPLAGSWSVYPMSMESPLVTSLSFAPIGSSRAGMQFYRGTLNVSTVADTYIALCGWNKGFVLVNGVNIGRFWDTQGPQYSYYIPAPLLVAGANDIIVFEQEGANTGASVQFVGGPDFTGAVCNKTSESTKLRASTVNKREKEPVMLRSNKKAVQPVRACAAPQVGINLTLQPCVGTPTSATSFGWPQAKPQVFAGPIQLLANPQLCVVVNGTNPSTGTPNLALGTCIPNDHDQAFLWFQGVTGGIMSVTKGSFFDLPNSSDSAGTRIELYSDNGGNANQRWNFQNGQLISELDVAMCIAAC